MSVQLENGYTKIANEIIDALCKFRIRGESWQVLMAIFRKTYGFNKTEDWISNSQIVEITGLHKGNASRELSKLITQHIVIKSDNKLKLNKKTEEWKNIEKKVIKSDNKVIKSDTTVINIDTKVIKSDVHKRQYTKETITKDINNGKPVFGKENGMESIKGILSNKIQPTQNSVPSKQIGISTQWQEKAFRYAKGLNLNLTGSDKGRWLKMFKQASEGRKTTNLDEAYTFLFDYPKQITNEQKMLFFFKIYENGKSWMNKFEGR